VIPIPIPLILVAAGALVASLLGNALQLKLYLGARDERVEATGARDQARAAATSCNAAVERLTTQAAARAKAAASGRRQADVTARTHEQRAQEILVAPAAMPGDECRSAAAEVDRWLQGRGKP
jgi:hypothetical protein